MRTVISFDVSDDKVRYRLVKVLKEYATRVQKSVFEGPELEHAAYLRMRSRCERLIDPETDRLRYYRICASCAARIEHAGTGIGVVEPPGPFEVIG
jgi:CRISPR-associated protein Cas2